jgi:hypothetical protein
MVVLREFARAALAEVKSIGTKAAAVAFFAAVSPAAETNVKRTAARRQLEAKPLASVQLGSEVLVLLVL